MNFIFRLTSGVKENMDEDIDESKDELRNSDSVKPENVDISSLLSPRVAINVSGVRYETRLETLERYPDTLLGNPDRRQLFYDRGKDEYFFDRNRRSFEGILIYYQTGIIERPANVQHNAFMADIRFYDLGKEIFDKYRRKEGAFTDDDMITIPKNVIQRKMWLFLEYPESSMCALVYHALTIFFILLSIINFVLESTDSLNQHVDHYIKINGTMVRNALSFGDWRFENPFFTIRTSCVILFAIELFARFVVSPTKKRFFFKWLNIFDLVALVPFFVTLIILLVQPVPNDTLVQIVQVLRVLGVLRMMRLSRYSTGMIVLSKTLRASASEFAILGIFLMINATIFSTLIYYAELHVPNSLYANIPESYWWSITTMTTVGYGDVYPHGLWGKLVGCLAAVFGVMTLALPIPIIGAHFQHYYELSHNTVDTDAYDVSNSWRRSAIDRDSTSYKIVRRFHLS